MEKTQFAYPYLYPSRDAFGRVFSFMGARNFQDIFIEWTNRGREAAKGHVAAIDCKTARRSEDRADDKSPIHVASGGTANGEPSVHRRRFIRNSPSRAGRIPRAGRERWGSELGEGGEVAEDRHGGESEDSGPGLGALPNDAPTRLI